MARWSALTHYKEMTICVNVITQKPEKICLKVYDYDNNKTYFTDRFKTINGSQTFRVYMPITGRQVYIEVYNIEKGNVKNDTSFKIKEIYRMPLPKRLEKINVFDKKLFEFVDLAEKISYNCSYLQPQSYESKKQNFKIQVLPTIKDSTGNELTTPARISKSTGRIEISQKAFETYTVPMRMAILLHEFSHVYINEDVNDESEADLNGLLIYLSLGYPRIEAHEAWLDVFIGTPNEQNKIRYDIIKKFIQDFDSNKI